MISRMISAAAMALPLFLVFRRTVHMYQLCSYQSPSYKKYLRENKGETFGQQRLLPVALMLAGMLVSQILTTAAACFFVIINPIKKAKKPLVWTARVKRLAVTAAVIYIALCLICMEAVPAYILFMPYLIMALARINAPVEKAISDHYIRDAQRILREDNGVTVIGITGSYGKTSTKYFLKELLSVKYNVYMTPGNYNTTLGVTRAIREGLKPTHDIFLCEMGARHVGDIAELCSLFHPDIGVITAIGPQHLETFGSQENITAEKLELYRATKDRGGTFLNTDSPLIASNSYDGKVTLYGTGLGCDYRGSDISVGAFGSSFTVTAPDGASCRFTTRLLGPANVQNLIGAIAVANSLGIELGRLVPAVAALESVPHRLQLIAGGSGVWYIDDAYNSNPEGAKAALDTLSMCGDMARVMLTPGMVELGEREAELNREMGRYAADKCDYAVLVDKKRGPDIKQGLLDGGFPEDRIFLTDSLEKGLEFTRGIAGSRMVLLLNDLPDHY